MSFDIADHKKLEVVLTKLEYLEYKENAQNLFYIIKE